MFLIVVVCILIPLNHGLYRVDGVLGSGSEDGNMLRGIIGEALSRVVRSTISYA